MSYRVELSYPSGLSAGKDFDDFDEALAAAVEESKKPGWCWVHLYGDGYDVDCDQGGYFVCDDGLTDDERLKVEEAGL